MTPASIFPPRIGLILIQLLLGFPVQWRWKGLGGASKEQHSVWKCSTLELPVFVFVGVFEVYLYWEAVLGKAHWWLVDHKSFVGWSAVRLRENWPLKLRPTSSSCSLTQGLPQCLRQIQPTFSHGRRVLRKLTTRSTSKISSLGYTTTRTFFEITS